MADEDRITQLVSQGVPFWEPESRLVHLTQEEIRFSRGFLPCEPSTLVDGFAERWMPLLLSLDSTARVTRCTNHLGPLGEMEFLSEISIDDEIASIGFSKETYKAMADTVFGEQGEPGDAILVEYISRRFVTCLGNSLKFDPIPSIKYVSASASSIEPSVSHIRIEFVLNGVDCEMRLGLGVRATEYVDAAWRRHVTRRTATRGFQYSDQLHNVSIELAELSVEPAVLIDYVRTGTVINLETAIGSPVLVRLNEVPWISGELAVFRGCYVVRADDLNCKPNNVEDGKTKVRIELARFQLDQEGVIEAQQVGAMLATRFAASASANLIIGGEQVAAASIHEADGNFSLTIIAR